MSACRISCLCCSWARIWVACWRQIKMSKLEVIIFINLKDWIVCLLVLRVHPPSPQMTPVILPLLFWNCKLTDVKNVLSQGMIWMWYYRPSSRNTFRSLLRWQWTCLSVWDQLCFPTRTCAFSFHVLGCNNHENKQINMQKRLLHWRCDNHSKVK